MLGFVNFLIERGYKPYRRDKKGNYIPCKDISYFSSTVPNYIDIRLIKGSKEVIYGLHEKGLPPTLIYPRPNGIVWDHQMNRLFETLSFEELYQLLAL